MCNNKHATADRGKILGLTISRQGYCDHVSSRREVASNALEKLCRFSDMPINVKTHLVKTLVLPVLDYPPIPTHALSNAQLNRLQVVQNKALRFATGKRYPYALTTEDLYALTKTLALNIRLHQQAEKIWTSLPTMSLPILEL